MPATIHLRDTSEHTLTEILNLDPKSEVEIIMRGWVKHYKVEDFSSFLTFNVDYFTPSGTLCYYNNKADSEAVIMMPTTPLKELYNLRRYIQHLILESEHDDDEFDSPLNEDNWLFQPRGKFMKYVIYHSSDVTQTRTTAHSSINFDHSCSQYNWAPCSAPCRAFNSSTYITQTNMLLSHLSNTYDIIKT